MDMNRMKQFDEYAEQKLLSDKDIMKEVLKTNSKEGLPSIDVSPLEGKHLQLLVKLKGAKNILEIGTLGGYSTICMAKALPRDGKIVTLEYSEKHAAVAKSNIKRAGYEEQVDIIQGTALDTLPLLPSKGYTSFDFIFIDADKRNNLHYVKEAINLAAPGAALLVDNVVRNGKVIEKDANDPDVQGIRDMFDFLSQEPRIDATAIQTVGSKGHDGFLLAYIQ